MIDRILNLSIFIVTLILMIRFFRKDGKWTAEKAGTIFRDCTVLSSASSISSAEKPYQPSSTPLAEVISRTVSSGTLL